MNVTSKFFMDLAEERGVRHNNPVRIGTNQLEVVFYPFDNCGAGSGIMCFTGKYSENRAEIVKNFKTIRFVRERDMYCYLNGYTHLSFFNELTKSKSRGIVKDL